VRLGALRDAVAGPAARQGHGGAPACVTARWSWVVNQAASTRWPPAPLRRNCRLALPCGARHVCAVASWRRRCAVCGQTCLEAVIDARLAGVRTLDTGRASAGATSARMRWMHGGRTPGPIDSAGGRAWRSSWQECSEAWKEHLQRRQDEVLDHVTPARYGVSISCVGAFGALFSHMSGSVQRCPLELGCVLVRVY